MPSTVTTVVVPARPAPVDGAPSASVTVSVAVVAPAVCRAGRRHAARLLGSRAQGAEGEATADGHRVGLAHGTPVPELTPRVSPPAVRHAVARQCAGVPNPEVVSTRADRC